MTTSDPNVVLAIAAHPDDIEFMMAGTLLRLRDAGWAIHCFNVANGSCGSVELDAGQIAEVRTAEARAAADVLGAELHPPLVDDFEILYTPGLLARVAAVVRRVNPGMLLVPAPEDYMEDHVNAARLAVTAGFTRGMPNFPTDPPTPPVEREMCVYHALPWGLTDTLRRPVGAELFVDITPVMEEKCRALSCHRSQKEWLDRSQGLDSYLHTMERMSARVGEMSGRFRFAEGWRRHSHPGFGAEPFDPLTGALGDAACTR